MTRRLFFEPGLTQEQVEHLAHVAAETGCGQVQSIRARLSESPSYFIDVTHFREAAMLCDMLTTLTDVRCYIGPGATATTDSRRRLIGRLLRHGLELGVAIDEGYADDDEHENSWSSSTLADFKLSVGQSNAATPGRRPKATHSRLTAVLESAPAFEVNEQVNPARYAAPLPKFTGPAIEPGRLYLGAAVSPRTPVAERVLHFIELHTGIGVDVLTARMKSTTPWLMDVHDRRMGEALASRLTRLLRHPVIFRALEGTPQTVPDALLDDLAVVAKHHVTMTARQRLRTLDDAAMGPTTVPNGITTSSTPDTLRSNAASSLSEIAMFVWAVTTAGVLAVDVYFHGLSFGLLPKHGDGNSMLALVGLAGLAGGWLWWLGPHLLRQRILWAGGANGRTAAFRCQYITAYRFYTVPTGIALSASWLVTDEATITGSLSVICWLAASLASWRIYRTSVHHAGIRQWPLRFWVLAVPWVSHGLISFLALSFA